MKKSTKPSRFSSEQVADLRQAKTVLPKDCPVAPARFDAKPKSSCSNDVRSNNHLAWYVALNIKQPKKISSIPQIKWKCPPEFALNTAWHVAAGEGSQEADAKKYREMSMLDVVNTDLTAIPPSPFSRLLMEGDHHDNSQTPIIPIIPIEEIAAEIPFDTSAAMNSSINPEPPASCPLISGNLPIAESSPSESQDQPVHAESPLSILHGIGSGDLKIAAAAAATVAAIMQRKEDIDTELLIKCLTNPDMIKKLMNGNGLASKPEDEAPPAPKAAPSLAPASVVDKLANGCSEQVNKAFLFNSMLQTVIQSPVLPCSKAESETNNAASKLPTLPCSKAESETNNSASKLGGTQAVSGQSRTSNAVKRPSPSPRLISHRPTKKVTGEHGGPASRIDQVAREQKVRPVVPSTLRPVEETMNRQSKKFGHPDVTGLKPNPSTSKPDIEVVKKMIHDYGAPDVARVKPVAPLVLCSSFLPNEEEVNRTIEKYISPDHGWRPTPLFASTAAPPMTKCGRYFPEVDLLYHKSLIKQHGEIHETGEVKFPKFCQTGNLQGRELGHKVTTINMNPKRKPCLYFNRPTGCRNGYSCPYQHDVSK